VERTSPLDVAEPLQQAAAAALPPVDGGLAEEMYGACGAAQLGWDADAFAAMLADAVARRPEGTEPESYLRGLHMQDLALAQACARGYEAAWTQFVAEYRARLTQAAVAISKSLSLGEELADSLYAELYGLKDRDGERRSPLASYSGRGSLMGWLRTTMAQRHVDRFRRTRREDPIEDDEFAAEPTTTAAPAEAVRVRIESAVHAALRGLEAEERFLLAAYFLDGRTLLEISRLLRVHEATVSRKIKRLTKDVRKQVLRELQRRGLSRAAAEEALGTDPRDLTVNLRKILQTSTGPPFSD